MIATDTESRATAAELRMARDRAELRAMFDPSAEGAGRPGGFPRSATLRWVIGHLSPRAIAWTALTTALARIPLAPLIGGVLSGRRH